MSDDLPEPPFRVGERFEKALVLDAASIRAFATMVGDFNPLHHDETIAARSRFGGLIASAAQTSALMAAFTATFVTERTPGVGLDLAFRFHKAVRADDPLELVWTVEGVEPKPRFGGHVIAFTGAMTDSAGDIAVSDRMKIVTLREEP